MVGRDTGLGLDNSLLQVQLTFFNSPTKTFELDVFSLVFDDQTGEAGISYDDVGAGPKYKVRNLVKDSGLDGGHKLLDSTRFVE